MRILSKPAHLACSLVIVCCLQLSAQAAQGPALVTVDSPSPLIHIQVMVKAGSAQDPPGLEGLAGLTGRLLIEGGFGDLKNPLVKDKLAEKTRPWGGAAYPSVTVSKEITTFSMTVPQDVLGQYIREVLTPMFARPFFAEAELSRVRAEKIEKLRSSLRLESIENLGLVALDNVIHARTSYAHPDLGTVKGLSAVDAQSVRRFYVTYYKPDNMAVGVSTQEGAIAKRVQESLRAITPAQQSPLPAQAVQAPYAVRGRRAWIVALPSALSTGLHAGFPLPLTRRDKDYWPLYVANVWLGTHRDSFSHLYKVIREARGYNYGDYSYIEHFEGRPEYLFPPPHHPRSRQYFSLWIRPVAHGYAHAILKAMTWELENFVRAGLTEGQCAQAKNKAKVLYLSLAETTDRILGSRLDDAFYGLSEGYLDGYLQHIDRVGCDEVNASIRKYLQTDNLEYVVVTDQALASKLALDLAADRPAWGKGPADYQIDSRQENGRKLYLVPEEKLDLLRMDAVWAHYPLSISKDRIHILPVEQMFETADLPQNNQ